MYDTHKLFGTIQKVEEQEDGTIKVFGIASSETRDAAKEIVLADAMKSALPDYSRFPALREMHQPMAAGKVLEADVDDDNITHIVAHVVDPVAITKVKTGVYAGFSIGGKVLKRDPTDRSIITALKLVEISLVDSPCNPDAVLSMWKADTMTEFKPASADVIARAKQLAKAAGTARFKDFLFEAGQELTSEHLLEKGDVLNTPPEVITDPGAAGAAVAEAIGAEHAPPAAPKEAAATADTATDISAAEIAAGEGENTDTETDTATDKEAAAVVPPETTDEGDGAGEGAEEPSADKEAAAAPDPVATLEDALLKAGNAANEVAPVAEEPVDPFADLGKAAAALKAITLVDGQEALGKSLWHVGRFAELLSSFACLQECVTYEANSENDGSPIPAELAAAIKTLGALLVRMAQEEVAELLAPMGDGEPAIIVVEEIALAEQIVDLVKADTTLATEAAERLAKRAPVEDNTAEVTELKAENERLSKALGEAAPQVEEITKRFTETVDGLKAQVADLMTKFEALDQTPLPPKTAGPGVTTAVTKGKDAEGAGAASLEAGVTLTDEQFAKAWSELSDDERGFLLVKASLANPGVIAAASRLPAA
jgi:ribosomal protein L16 Arg81 hydroxylase